MPNAIELLEVDHKKVKKLLERGDDTTENAVKTRTELYSKIRSEMEVHEAIEEEIFYPALKEHPKAKEVVLEGYEEHHVVDQIMGELGETPVEDERWGAKFSVMKENIEHHIEEEEDDMFKKAHDVFSKKELDELGDRMAARKKELEAR
ncbi:MAG TPA: hemerythrin domain-containing protein [Actinomycetota bacterium]